ncbi:MAG: FHA domain-containing protein, partial [Phototrophicaceae bacterium]
MSDAKRSAPSLIVLDGPNANHAYSIDKSEVVIGREDTCDIVLNERQISREHVRIFESDGRFFIEDKGSRNGTWINGKKLENATQELYDN